ncbi:MAG TPA: glycosyltransferase family 4 protein [Verrucomicrobiae bacterium]|nr:glycosyltransferase family 4 protein [Verrucomicrobiae bacterium]
MNRGPLVVIESHPIPYHAPIYRVLQDKFGIAVTAIYGSDFSVAGYQDDESGATFSWDADLLSGYTSTFLSRVAEGGARSGVDVTTRGLRATLRAAVPEVVMLVGHNLRFDRRAFLMAHRAGHPILFRGEMLDRAPQGNGLKDWARDKAFCWFYDRCDRLLYTGQRAHEHFRRLGCPEDKLVFSPACVDTAPFQCDERARDRLRGTTRAALKIDPDKTVILVSGKLSKHKGPDVLLRAIKQLPAGGHDRVVALFLGSGELQGELQVLAQQPPAVVAHFLGSQDQNQLSKYYHAADLLVLPSLEREDWGLVVNIALHHGLPCVVSAEVGCSPDLIEPGVTGEIFQPWSVHDLTSVLQQSMKLTGQMPVRQACRRKASGYGPGQAAEGIATAYDALRGRNRPTEKPQ